MAINDEIEKLRNAATASLFERSDTIIVASVSCIYGLGDPEEYNGLQVNVREGDEVNRNSIMRRLVEIQYTRNDTDFKRSTFRVKGDTLDIFPANSSEIAVRIEFFGDEIERIYQFNHLTGEKIAELKSYTFFPATHYAISRPRLLSAISQIEKDAENILNKFSKTLENIPDLEETWYITDNLNLTREDKSHEKHPEKILRNAHIDKEGKLVVKRADWVN